MSGSISTRVVHEIQQIPDNGWKFATHLTDILYHCGKLKILDKHQNNVTSRLRDSLVMDYGSLLMEHQSLWQAGLSYLVAVPEGAARAHLLLERMPVRSDQQALRVIAEANKYGLDDVARGVCATMCVRACDADRLGSALGWALRGGGGGVGGGRRRGRWGRARGGGAGGQGGAPGAAALRARRVAARGRRAAHRGPRAAALRAAARWLTRSTHAYRSPGRTRKYCEFHRLYKSKEFKKAAKLLVSLLTSKIAPDYFWDTLLLDTLPLLESDEACFLSRGHL
ncbi:hypothetical protein ACJJTC_002882 [Scirpophaga incertulas]